MLYNGREWDGCREAASDAHIQSVQHQTGYVLPDDYRDCLRVCHGGRPRQNAFQFVDPDLGLMEGCVGVLLSPAPDDPEGLFDALGNMSESLLRGALPIADDGGGDFVCLDYGAGQKPTIGYWHRGAGSLVHLATSFGGFLAMLSDPSLGAHPPGSE